MLTSLIENPAETLKSLLIMLPGILLALSIHECAHGWVADRCGDPTARNLGRITLNPLKHLNPLGFLCMLFVGFGWANPVPVNPNNYRNYRRDDLRVSIAGITANLALFFACFIIISLIFTCAVNSLPAYDSYADWYFSEDKCETFVFIEDGESCVMTPEGYIDEEGLFEYCYALSDEIIAPAFGEILSILYQMLVYCMYMNLSLAVFNLIPLPPLDGYHVLNVLVLKQDLFAQRKTERTAGTILIILIIIGDIYPQYDVISIAISAVRQFALSSLTVLTRLFAGWIGVI